ncbi:hypothetical protein CASFOL_019636 [Castilleja foliolosa]|uniref:Stress response protein NST1 n=1 Tax=Castilleja foliolosa TaxID=1961234 RepID=A0ABD3D9A4_9LAMI
MPGLAQGISSNSSGDNNDSNSCYQNPLVGNGKVPFHSFNGSSVPSNGFWSQHRDEVSYNHLQKFWCDLTPQARQNLLRIDKQTLFEHARKNMYCSRCNGLLLEGFLQIVMYGKSLQQDAAGSRYSVKAIGSQNDDADLCMANGCQDDVRDPSVHPWGVFDSARAREREREMLYPDACGGGGRGWISQGVAGYGRGHGTRETCALHTARLSVETLVDFWSALGEETRQSLLRMKEEDFIERLMYRFDSKRFCRDCRRNVIREFKELKELKRMRKETRCTRWFCVADTAFQYEVSRDTVLADWHQTFSDAFGTYHHFEWAIGTGEGKYDILEFENVGLVGKVQVSGLDLSEVNACYITLRAFKIDGRCNELCVKAHALRGKQCVHCRFVVGDGILTITRGESITRFFEHAEEAEEEEDDDSMDKDGNDLDGECSRPQKHAKSPELAREFLLDAATVIFKEQVEKAFREGTARQNAHSIFVCLALKLLEERVHVACKEIITLEKQMKLLEEEEKEKREEEERKERRRTKEREKKLRRKERLREKENRDKKPAESNIDGPVVTDVTNEELTNPSVDEVVNECSRDSGDDDERGEATPNSPLSPDNIEDDQLSTGYTYSINKDNNNPSEDIPDDEFSNNKDWYPSFPYDHHLKYSRRKLVVRKDLQQGFNLKWQDRRKGPSENDFESTRSTNGFNKQLRTNAASSNLRYGSSKSSEKFQCTNNRIGGDRYDSHSCSCNHHHNPEYRPRSEPHNTKPYNRGKTYTQVDCPREFNGRPKSKIIPEKTPTTKKVWEPLDSQKKCIQSMKTKASESDQLPECCSTSSDEVTDISVVQTSQDLTRSTSENRKQIENEYHTMTKPQSSSMSTSSNSDNCSSCLSEGDNSNPQNTESTSTSDSEESSQISDGKETPDAVEEDHNTPLGQNGKIVKPTSAGTNTLDSSLKDVGPYCVQNVLPQMHQHNGNINYPIFQAPAMGYYHQNPVSWQPGPTNGMLAFPHSNHYLFPNSFEYSLNGNAPFMQYGTLQHLAPPLPNHAPHMPVFQPVSQLNGKNVTGLKKADNSVIPKGPSTERLGTPVVDEGQNWKADKTDMANNGFSLFHFGGPAALSTGFKGDHPVSLNEGIVEDMEKLSARCPGVDHPCSKKESIEEYNLFAATNGIKFSIF